MTAVNFGNRRYTRLWPILLLLCVALLLLWKNLQQAHQLTQNRLIKMGLSKPNWTLSGDFAAEDYLDCVEPLGISLKQDSPRTRELQRLLNCRNRPLRFQRLQHGEFWLLQNLVIGRKSRQLGCTESITYTTNGDYTFFDNLETVVERWGGPISFAIHAPGYDLNVTLDAIQYVRNCLPGSEAISDWVSFHVYFSNQHMPEDVPYDEDEVLGRPYFCTLADGSLVPPPYTLIDRSDSYKVKANLTYPINVGRNIARQAVNTHFIFACDIELYPSLGFVDQFLDMVAQNHSVLALDPSQPRRVYPLAVFEIEAEAQLPGNKTELLALYRKQKAQVFHLKLCPTCHKIPGQQDWLNRAPSVKDQLELFSMSLREKQFRTWEPFYVSDNTEPLFDERVTWEGQSNKRIQNYAMCLLGYEYHVLHPAFLVHSPGIKKLTKAFSTRLKYAKAMTKFIKAKIEPEYRVLYGHNADCRT
ncbi:hypothetical protein KR038_010422 [Drosophila bunnanda]|nr:hypothetical protein KR038_010422 [Drosophila bunnanda]